MSTATLPFATVVASSGHQHGVTNLVGADIWGQWYAGRGVATKVIRHLPEALVIDAGQKAHDAVVGAYEIDPDLDHFALTNLAEAIGAEMDEAEAFAALTADIEANDELAAQFEQDQSDADFEKAENDRFMAKVADALNDLTIRELRPLAKGRFNSKTMGKAEVVANLVKIVEDDPTAVNDILAAAGLPTFTEPF